LGSEKYFTLTPIFLDDASNRAGQAWDGLDGFTDDVFGAATDWEVDFGDDFFTDLGGFGNDILTGLDEFGTDLAKFGTDLFTDIDEFGDDLFTDLGQFGSDFLDDIGAIGTDIFNSISDIDGGEIIDSIVKFGEGIVEDVEGFGKTIFGTINDVIIDPIANLGDEIAKGVVDLGKFIDTEVISPIKNIIDPPEEKPVTDDQVTKILAGSEQYAGLDWAGVTATNSESPRNRILGAINEIGEVASETINKTADQVEDSLYRDVFGNATTAFGALQRSELIQELGISNIKEPSIDFSDKFFEQKTGGLTIEESQQKFFQKEGEVITRDTIETLFTDPVKAHEILMNNPLIHTTYRDILNENTPSHITDLVSDKWAIQGTGSSIFHGSMFDHIQKYITMDGGYREVVFDPSGQRVDSDVTKGTFNFFSPDDYANSHILVDVDPYVKHGN
jgi:hypothetical protein